MSGSRYGRKIFYWKDGSINYSKLYFKGSNPQIMAEIKHINIILKYFGFIWIRGRVFTNHGLLLHQDEKGVATGHVCGPPGINRPERSD